MQDDTVSSNISELVNELRDQATTAFRLGHRFVEPGLAFDNAHDLTTGRSVSPTICSIDISPAMSLDQEIAGRLPGWYVKWFSEWWGFEILSMILSTMCIIAITILLKNIDGIPLHSWRLGVSVEAVLSMLAALSKSCLLMPTAEALGQIKWLWAKRSEHKAIEIERLHQASG